MMDSGDLQRETFARHLHAPAPPVRRLRGEHAIVVTGGLAPWQQRQVLRMLEDNLEVNVSAAQLAATCKLSLSHFRRCFREIFGMSVHRWIIHERLMRAKQLLAAQEAPLAQIALCCGFSDQSHFSRVFKQYEGVTAGNWRRSSRPVADAGRSAGDGLLQDGIPAS